MRKLIAPFIILFLVITSCKTVPTTVITSPKTFIEKIQAVFPKAEITETENFEGFKATYQLILEEPLDHSDLSKGTFKHYVYLSHNGFDLPTVIETEENQDQNLRHGNT